MAPSILALSNKLALIEEKLKQAMGTELHPIKQDSKLLISFASEVKCHFHSYHECISDIIIIRTKEGCIDMAKTLKEERKMIKNEVREHIALVNTYLDEAQKIDDLSLLTV